MVINLSVYPSIAQLGARVDGLIHSFTVNLLIVFVAAFDFSLRCSGSVAHKFSITVNVKCHCQWNPANQIPRTTGNTGRRWCKSSSEVWFGPGLNNNFMVTSLQVWRWFNSKKIELLKLSGGATNFTFSRVWTCLCFHMTPVLLLLLLFFFFHYLHLLYKSGKHWANTHWIKFQKQQVVSVGFPSYRT